MAHIEPNTNDCNCPKIKAVTTMKHGYKPTKTGCLETGSGTPQKIISTTEHTRDGKRASETKPYIKRGENSENNTSICRTNTTKIDIRVCSLREK
jgi:hypothetical protein